MNKIISAIRYSLWFLWALLWTVVIGTGAVIVVFFVFITTYQESLMGKFYTEKAEKENVE